jgi:hypothetical protein
MAKLLSLRLKIGMFSPYTGDLDGAQLLKLFIIDELDFIK